MSQSIKIVSISTDLGANKSTVVFKTFEQVTPVLSKQTGEYTVEVDGRYDTFDDHELIHVIEALFAGENASA